MGGCFVFKDVFTTWKFLKELILNCSATSFISREAEREREEGREREKKEKRGGKGRREGGEEERRRRRKRKERSWLFYSYCFNENCMLN